MLRTRAAKWGAVQVGGGRTVSEVAAGLSCDWDGQRRPGHLGRSPARGRSQAVEQDQRHRARRDLLRPTRPEEAHQLRHHSGRRGQPPDHRHPLNTQIRRCSSLDRRPGKVAEGKDPLRHPRHVQHLRRGVHGHLAQDRPRGRPPSISSHQPTQPRRRGAGCRQNTPGGSATSTPRPNPPKPGRCSKSSSPIASNASCRPRSSGSERRSAAGSTRSSTSIWPG